MSFTKPTAQQLMFWPLLLVTNVAGLLLWVEKSHWLFALLAVLILLCQGLKRPISYAAVFVLAGASNACLLWQQTALDEVASLGYWLSYAGNGLLIVLCAIFASLHVESWEKSVGKYVLEQLLPSLSVPIVLLCLWQGLVAGHAIPKGIFPGVDDVAWQLQQSLPVLLRDSYTTFVREILFGFILGVSSGFLAAIGVANSRFLQAGFLPYAAAFGAVPIVGLAPVLGRAFGVDWESKAAVVVIVTFFPVLLNTVQGLKEVDGLKLELMQAYAASKRQIFFQLRLPNALPYLFNALKLAVVISIISVIVAEFLIPGPPRGLGQRISLSARQGAYDLVFAAIVVSSLISISLYQLVSWWERRLTSWHPSFRETS